MEVLEEAMNTMKYKGFINYYGIPKLPPSSSLTYDGFFRYATVRNRVCPYTLDRLSAPAIRLAKSCRHDSI